VEDLLGPLSDAPVTRATADHGRVHGALAVTGVAAVLVAVPALWLELVPLAWAAPFVLIYALVVVPVLFTEARRRRRLPRTSG
jgi:Flp pilus assembly protein TadB